MKKKILALFLAGTMVVVGMAGCGSKDNGGSEDTKGQESTESPEGEDTGEESKAVENKEATIEVPDEVTKGGELKIALTSSPQNLDPVKYTGLPSLAYPKNSVFANISDTPFSTVKL